MTEAQDPAVELADQLGELLNGRLDDPRTTARILSLFWRAAVTNITCAGCRCEHLKIVSKMVREAGSFASSSSYIH